MSSLIYCETCTDNFSENHDTSCKFHGRHDKHTKKSLTGGYFVELDNEPAACPVCLEAANDCYCGYEEIGLKCVAQGDFKHVKQSYKDEYPTTLICACGATEFIVGQGSYFTAIKCTKCGIEKSIHSG